MTTLPHLLSPTPYLDTCGIETTLIFLESVDLPEFAAFDLLRRPGGDSILRRFYSKNLEIASEFGLGMVVDTPTWRANMDWARKLGCSETELRDVIRRSVELLIDLRTLTPRIPVVISGCIGPRGDGYIVTTEMSIESSLAYHSLEVESLVASGVDLITAITMTYTSEAIGIALSAKNSRIPVAISFTVETNGRLPSGETLASAIQRVDQLTETYPAYYMINCAHPSHFESEILSGDAYVGRIRGVLVNASRKSHEELNECTEVDAGEPETLAEEVERLRTGVPGLAVVGGCCGTDYRHIRCFAQRFGRQGN